MIVNAWAAPALRSIDSLGTATAMAIDPRMYMTTISGAAMSKAAREAAGLRHLPHVDGVDLEAGERDEVGDDEHDAGDAGQRRNHVRTASGVADG